MQFDRRKEVSGAVRGTVVALVALLAVGIAEAGPREQAKRIHDRIAGVPPDATVLAAMEAEISAGRAEQAAFLAMEHPDFYSVTLKNLDRKSVV